MPRRPGDPSGKRMSFEASLPTVLSPSFNQKSPVTVASLECRLALLAPLLHLGAILRVDGFGEYASGPQRKHGEKPDSSAETRVRGSEFHVVLQISINLIENMIF